MSFLSLLQSLVIDFAYKYAKKSSFPPISNGKPAELTQLRLTLGYPVALPQRQTLT